MKGFVVDLDLAGWAGTAKVGSVPSGAYKRLTAMIHKPEDDSVAPELLFREGQGRSVALGGHRLV